MSRRAGLFTHDRPGPCHLASGIQRVQKRGGVHRVLWRVSTRCLEHGPSYQVRGALTDGFDSTVSSMRTLFPGARLGYCLRHALNKLPDKLIGVRPRCAGLRSKFHALLHRCRQRKSLRVVALGQRLRHFAAHIATTVGEAHGKRVRQWFQDKLCREKRQGGM